jgi:hypothetical protein
MIGRLLLRRRRIHDNASPFVDGALGSRDREAFAHHLAVCAHCRNEVAELRDAKGMLRALGTVALPRSFALTPAMVAQPDALSGETSFAGGWGSLRMPRLAASVSTMTAAALVAAVVIDIGGGSGAASSQLLAEQAAVAVVESAPAETFDPAMAQAPVTSDPEESTLLTEGDSGLITVQDAPLPVEAETPVEMFPEEVVVAALPEEVVVAALPELDNVALPGSDNFGSVALSASEPTGDAVAGTRVDITPEEDAGIGTAAVESEEPVGSEAEEPAADAPTDYAPEGDVEPLAEEAAPETAELDPSAVTEDAETSDPPPAAEPVEEPAPSDEPAAGADPGANNPKADASADQPMEQPLVEDETIAVGISDPLPPADSAPYTTVESPVESHIEPPVLDDPVIDADNAMTEEAPAVVSESATTSPSVDEPAGQPQDSPGTSAAATIPSDRGSGDPWLRPLQIALGVVVVAGAALSVWLRRREPSH